MLIVNFTAFYFLKDDNYQQALKTLQGVMFWLANSCLIELNISHFHLSWVFGQKIEIEYRQASWGMFITTGPGLTRHSWRGMSWTNMISNSTLRGVS